MEVRELKLLTDSRAVFKNWVKQDEESYRPLESEWYSLMNEEKKLKHAIHVRVAGLAWLSLDCRSTFASSVLRPEV